MPVTTTSAAIHITPVVFKTLFSHGKKKAKKIGKSSSPTVTPQDDIVFDEAFHIVKSFIELGTKNTIDSLQAFTNTRVPAPYWAAVSPVIIPLSACNNAADLLINWFGPEELKYVVGGERWWQVRGLSGIESEWIAELEDIDAKKEVRTQDDEPLSDQDANIKRMESLQTVMLYVHGGGYSWGSINTHRYQILHYAHKMRGRAFAVNYRKAPQYPWPCALQDVLAAYLYLIRPPKSALHAAVSPSHIVFAGDSAGGGLCLTALTVLRDLGLPMPAGAVLISPWVDLTHSFPSVMENTKTDIIPEHGFLAKPSTLWPVPTVPEHGGRIVPTVSNAPPIPGEADTLRPPLSRIGNTTPGTDSTVYGPGETVQTQEEMLAQKSNRNEQNEKSIQTGSSIPEFEKALQSCNLDHWEPKPPKLFMENPNAQPLELRSQIQMYATTEQLTHPLVSPVLQGSLGNLPPLYIIAGDSEVLRDEVIYLAHKAAHPSKYPTRRGVLESLRQQENAKKFTTPTKVHLQVFDGMCHVLTVFMFTESARYAYRSIAEFAKHVTQNSKEHILRNPFPELHKDAVKHGKEKTPAREFYSSESMVSKPTSSPGSRLEMNLYLKNERMAIVEVDRKLTDMKSDSSFAESNGEKKGSDDDIPGTVMIRERVDIHGNARPMESPDNLQALRIEAWRIGILKEAPAQRWRKGQDIWDKRYAKRAKKVIKQKKANTAKAEHLLERAIAQGFVHQSHKPSVLSEKRSYQEKIEKDRRWGPLDLEDENPPATAIAARRDTLEAIALLESSIYYTAPATHLTVPENKKIDTGRATLCISDDEVTPSKQSAAEEQVPGLTGPMHGLRIWDDLVSYFGRKTAAKAANGINIVSEKVGLSSK